jgi:rRNA maturation RNase YbeY
MSPLSHIENDDSSESPWYIKPMSILQAYASKKIERSISKVRKVPALNRLGPKTKKWSVDVRLVGAPAMKKLNHRYRQNNQVTDILSFDAPAIFRKQGVLGELVICLPQAKKQAKEFRHSPERELDILLTHGLLHLLGFDHEKGPKQAKAMARWEAKLLKKTSGLIARAQ